MAKIYNMDGSVKGEMKLPSVFTTAYRPDLIQRAVLAIQSANRQAYSSDPLAGKRTSAHYHGARKKRYSMMNKEMARMARSHNTSSQQELRARFVPQARSGRATHPPKAEKVWLQKINNKERKLAIASAIAAASQKMLVIVDDLESLKKTKDIKTLMLALKLENELERAKIKTVRAGRGKMRGRKYKRKKSALFVVSKNNGILHAAENMPGADVCSVKCLNAELLAPGCRPGRLSIWSESAVKQAGEIYG